MNRISFMLLLSMACFAISAQESQNQLIGGVQAPEVLGGGACVVQNEQGAIASGFLGWVEGGVHAILIDPTGTGGAGDPGCAGSFAGQNFELFDATFTLADGTAFGSPNGETGIGSTTYTVSVHPLLVDGDPTMGPGPAIDSVTQTLTLDASGIYTVTANFGATIVTGPFFIAITFDDFNPDLEVTSTLWDGVARPLGRQFVNNGAGFVDQTDFFTGGENGWVVVTVDGDFIPAGGPVLPPPPAVPTMNSFGLLGMALALMLGAGLFLRRRA